MKLSMNIPLIFGGHYDEIAFQTVHFTSFLCLDFQAIREEIFFHSKLTLQHVLYLTPGYLALIKNSFHIFRSIFLESHLLSLTAFLIFYYGMANIIMF
jgi:hypothetical protein